MIPKHHQDVFATDAFPGTAAGRALARCWFCREKARVVITGWHARWLVVIINNGQWVPDRLIGLGVR